MTNNVAMQCKPAVGGSQDLGDANRKGGGIAGDLAGRRDTVIRILTVWDGWNGMGCLQLAHYIEKRLRCTVGMRMSTEPLGGHKIKPRNDPVLSAEDLGCNRRQTRRTLCFSF
ncbi:hypothetical protein JZ751_013765 [Albula glossodonta]|uniref:Uncharacterized protein n=1 Tax=Albula glossodonta TaxID=121402 RepID=A0A8T2NTB4_9TELE|nr:hypothetical protein JZ751_013765 [Albula glossodonta]